MRTNLAIVEKRRLLEAERQERARVELRQVSDGTAETIALRRLRGEEIATPEAGRGERTKPAKCVAALDWLLAKKHIDQRQFMAGEKYGARVQAGSPGIGSCLNVGDRVGMPQSTAPYGLAEVVTWAKGKLREDRREALHDVGYMIEICDQVCAYGKRPRQLATTQRGAERVLDRLLVGLDLLAAHYGL